ncbi:MAG TPA: Dabb family protein [Vicinamibacterales bacterium]|nr:Dabb family protein [Vicinamibacterales bacterium]
MLNSVVKAVLLVLLVSPLAVPLMVLASQNQKQQVRHIVVFKYKPGTTPEQIAQVTTAFRELRKTIPGIIGYEDGVNNSPEKKNLGFTHVYMVTFEDVKARDAYLPHPEHKKFGQLLGKLGVVEDVFVVDF